MFYLKIFKYILDKKIKYLDYVILVVIFVFSRILFLLFTPYSYYCEEAKIGSIGYDVVFERGLKLPFWGYLDSPHAGGSIFSGLTAVPFYLIFGDKYLALKITALIFSLLTLILWYRLLLFETKNYRQTFIFSLIFFTFATPHYVQKSVILAGNTVELMFFNILVITYFWKIKNNPVVSPAGYFFLGILCGFSFWVQFMSFYMFLTVVLILFLTERFKTAIHYCIYLLIGFLLGSLPLWIYNFQYRWATFTSVTADPRSQICFLFNPNKLGNFLTTDIPASFHFLDIGSIKAQNLSFIVYGLFISALLIHLDCNLISYIRRGSQKNDLKRIKISLDIFLVLYLTIFIVITSFTQFPVRGNEAYGWNSMNVHAEYYIVSLQLILFALVILLNKYKKKGILFINVTVSIIFIMSYYGLFHSTYYNQALFKPMHSTESNVYECGYNFVNNPELFLYFKQNISDELRRNYLKGAKDRWEIMPKKIKEQIYKKVGTMEFDYSEQYLKL